MAMGTSRDDLRFSASGPGSSAEFEEISLVDVVKVLHRRRAILAITLVLALLGGAAVTFFTTPEYEAESTIIPLQQPAIIKGWLTSRQAAEFSAEAVGQGVNRVLFPDTWDESSQTWVGVPPTSEEIALALLEHVTITGGVATTASRDSTLTVNVRLADAVVARDVARAYLTSLEELRPQLENITRSELFKQFYDGTNAQEAQARAETTARETTYWVVFDTPSVPHDPVKPRPVLNMALAGVLGVMGGVFVVFGLEWLAKYRTEFQRVEPPPR